MATATGGTKTLASSKDLITASKAIHDEVMGKVAGEMKSLRAEVASLRKQLEDSVGLVKSLITQIGPVTVNVPPPRLVKKLITYDEHGRPTGAEEFAKE